MSMRWYDRRARGARRQSSTLPTHFALTDPQRFPDILTHTDSVPEHWGIIYRHFGAPDRVDVAMALAQRAQKRNWLFLIARDPGLCAAVGAAGVHWPEVDLFDAARWRRRHRNLVFTMSAHSPRALRKAQLAGADAAFLSPVLNTNSPGAGTAIKFQRAGVMARAVNFPVYALGGMTVSHTESALKKGFGGLGMVSGVSA